MEPGKFAEVGDVTDVGSGGSGIAGGGDGNAVTEALLRRLEAEEGVRSGGCMLSRICDCGIVSGNRSGSQTVAIPVAAPLGFAKPPIVSREQ